MQRRTAIIIASLLVLLIASPVLVQAEDSNGVQASTSTLSFTGDAVEGKDITFYLSLYNSNPTEAKGVTYSLYPDEISNDVTPLKTAAVDIPGEEEVTVTATWSRLTAGEHQIWVEFNNGIRKTFYESFTVEALPNLEVLSTSFDPVSGAMSGDQIAVNIEIENSGTVDAGASTLSIDFAGTVTNHITPAINGQSTGWVNTTLVAPDAGTWPVDIELDIDDLVIESDDENSYSSQYVVDERMDLYHQGDVTVTTAEGALDGPWTFSGILGRTNGQGTNEVNMRIEVPDSSNLQFQPFVVNISGGEDAIKQWSQTLTREQLPLDPGIYHFEVVIDPFSTDSYIQENTSNDRIESTFTIFQIPDVVVDSIAIPSTQAVAGGDSLTWTVILANTGQIDVTGFIRYSWENQTMDSGPLTISAGENGMEWTVDLVADTGEHTATFTADWFEADGSWDDISGNSHAENTVSVLSQLRLIWSDVTESLVDSNGESVVLPLKDGENYTVSIELSSFDSGSLNFTCGESGGKVYEVIPVVVTGSNQWVTLSCTFTADAPNSELMLIPSDGGVTSTKTWSWPTAMPLGFEVNQKEDYTFATAMIVGLIGIGLIAILVVAIILTRESDGEVERDIFDYCPACDGELEGNENRCPHCKFNLKKARMQFHDCESCGELVPDLLDNCPYCGAAQDTSKYFEKRERLEIKQTIDLPDEEEIDEEEIVSGTEDFDKAVQEFGYDSDDLEGHWDERLADAETKVEEAQGRLDIEIEQSELDDEALEQIVETTLKSVSDSFSGNDIDAILSEKDEVVSHADDGDELSASDAKIRGRLFEITGEKGVMPGDKVTIGGASDSVLVGNEVPTEAMDFSFKDEQDKPLAESPRKAPRRRRNKTEEPVETPDTVETPDAVEKAECGVCGSEISLDDIECKTCGAKFE